MLSFQNSELIVDYITEYVPYDLAILLTLGNSRGFIECKLPHVKPSLSIPLALRETD